MLTNVKQCFASLLLLLSWQCAHAQNPEDFLNAPDRVQWAAGGLYDGRFDDGMPFQIELAYPFPEAVPRRAGNGFIQAVWYLRHYTGSPSTLLAVGRVGSQIRLAVANAQGIASEESFTVTLTPDRASGRGFWTKPGTAGQSTFTLRLRVPYVGIVVARPASDDLAADSSYYRENGFVFSTFFPILDDPEADSWIRHQAANCNDAGECANTVPVLWRSPSLVSLKAINWGDSGGAHGVGHSETRQYGIQDHTLTPLELDAFIDWGTSCRERVSAAIIAKLRGKNMSWADKAGLDARRKIQFTPTPDGVAFHYDSYEAGPYAQGAPTVFVPREEMGACVKQLPAQD